MNSNCLVLGTGNPLFGDDQIGILLGQKIAEKFFLPYEEGNSFGFEVLELLENYDAAIICDSIKVHNEEDVGEIFEYCVDDFKNAFHLTSPHTFNLATGLKFAELMNLKMPTKIKIIGIGILTPECFCEELSDALQNKISDISDKVQKISLKWLESIGEFKGGFS